jgi:hypothetical protein
MNERIRELAEQAEEYADSTGLGFAAWRSAQLNKFAELIVRECMELTKRCSTGSSIHDLFADEIIKQHFGVK